MNKSSGSKKKRSCLQTDPLYPELKSAVERLLAQDIEPTYRSISERFPHLAEEFVKASLSNQISRLKKTLRNRNPILNTNRMYRSSARSGVGQGGIFPSSDDDDSSFKSGDVSISSSSVVSEHIPSPFHEKRSSTPFPTASSATKKTSTSKKSSPTAYSFPSGVYVSKKKFHFGGVDGYYYAVTSILPSGLVTSNERNHLIDANSQLKSRIIDSKTGLIEIVIPKPKAFFKFSTFMSKSHVISHFFGDDDKHFKEIIGSPFDHDKDLMNHMHSDVKVISLNDEIDENIKSKGCTYISAHGIALYTILLKAREQKELSDDEGHIDLFACDSPSPHRNATPVPPSTTSYYHSHHPQGSSSTNINNLSHEETEQAFQAVAEQFNRSRNETQSLAQSIEAIRARLEEVEASSPSSARRRKVSSTAASPSTQMP